MQKDQTPEGAATTAHENTAAKRFVRAPVGWLLGPDLISKLRKILRKRSDPRDWMPYYRGCLHDEFANRDGKITRVGTGPSATTDASASAEKVAEPAKATTQASDKDVWFDYVSDLGDGADAMYAVALTTMTSFDGEVDPATWSRDQAPRELVPVGLRSNDKPPVPASTTKLPRGSFVFLGGDTAYHVADGPTLRARVEQPFKWAFEDAEAKGWIETPDRDKRPYRVYGIPGNHDWYDNLEGFSLVFRVGSPSAARAEQQVDPIDLPQLERVQLASYVAIQLPFGWQLWGLDIDSPMDPRQKAYFASLGIPERLILATPSPAIVQHAMVAGEAHLCALKDLEIAMPAMPVEEPTIPKHRLDLSGDTHHYARYYPNDKVKHYGSVVSGLGGAFHHPTFTVATGVKPRIDPVRMYPDPDLSREACGARLLRWQSTWFGSWARLIPFLLTVLCGFAAIRSVGGAWLLDHLLSLAPGYDVTPPGNGTDALWRALCALGVFVVAVGGVLFAVWWGRGVYQRGLDEPEAIQNVVDLWRNRRFGEFLRKVLDPRRSYWFAWTIGVALMAPFALYPLWGPKTFSVGLDLATLIIVIGLPLTGFFCGLFLFGADLNPVRRILVAVTGLSHAVVQVATAILIARLFTASYASALATLGATIVAAAMLELARYLFQSKRSIAVPALALLALAVAAVSLASMPIVAHGDYVHAGAWYWDTLRIIGSGIASMLLGTTWFVWYLAVAGRLHAHNNEVGGTARISKFRELIRFHLREDGLTGYVISVENNDERVAAHCRGTNLKFQLLDVFTIPTDKLRRSGPVSIGPPDPSTLENLVDQS